MVDIAEHIHSYHLSLLQEPALVLPVAVQVHRVTELVQAQVPELAQELLVVDGIPVHPELQVRELPVQVQVVEPRVAELVQVQAPAQLIQVVAVQVQAPPAVDQGQAHQAQVQVAAAVQVAACNLI